MKLRYDNPLFLALIGFAVTAAALTAVRAETQVVMKVIAVPPGDV